MKVDPVSVEQLRTLQIQQLTVDPRNSDWGADYVSKDGEKMLEEAMGHHRNPQFVAYYRHASTSILFHDTIDLSML
ncbi:hypothetical protein HBI60_259960, partial [Parastagonospora nodorum]